jgi:hypothetical protein
MVKSGVAGRKKPKPNGPPMAKTWAGPSSPSSNWQHSMPRQISAAPHFMPQISPRRPRARSKTDHAVGPGEARERRAAPQEGNVSLTAVPLSDFLCRLAPRAR